MGRSREGVQEKTRHTRQQYDVPLCTHQAPLTARDVISALSVRWTEVPVMSGGSHGVVRLGVCPMKYRQKSKNSQQGPFALSMF